MGAKCGSCSEGRPYDPSAASCRQPITSRTCSTASGAPSRDSSSDDISSRSVRSSCKSAGRPTRCKSAPLSVKALASTPCRRTARRATFISHSKVRVQNDYDLEAKVGEGNQGVVFRAKRKKTGIIRAVKKVLKKKGANATEIDIVRQCDHPNIIKLFETFEDREATYLVMELCQGGELFDRIVEQGSLSEREAAIVMQQILRAVNYLHAKDIAHRDLKPENFLFSSKGPIDSDNLLKLIDFGVACECAPGATLKELVGTPYYIAPQVVSERYDKRCDLWSCGVIMYVLLSGGVPFSGVRDNNVLAKVREGIVFYEAEVWSHVSEQGRHLVRKLLTRNASQRISSEEALSHDWIQSHAPTAVAQLQDGLIGDLRHFWRQNKLKKAALTIIASEMNDAKICSLRETFTALDTDGDGLLTLADIQHGMDEAGIEFPPEYAELLAGEDEDMVLDYSEFLAATISKRHHICEESCRLAFGMFDMQGKGWITAQDITRTFGKAVEDDSPIRHCDSRDIIQKYDVSGDGRLDFDSFKAMVSEPHDCASSPMATLRAIACAGG